MKFSVMSILVIVSFVPIRSGSGLSVDRPMPPPPGAGSASVWHVIRYSDHVTGGSECRPGHMTGWAECRPGHVTCWAECRPDHVTRESLCSDAGRLVSVSLPPCLCLRALSPCLMARIVGHLLVHVCRVEKICAKQEGKTLAPARLRYPAVP